MKKIGLISDTHGYLDDAVFKHFDNCDEIWHAGDFGNASIAAQLADFRPLHGVFGNIDGYDIRSSFPERDTWNCGNIRIHMRHIGGNPDRYAPGVREDLKQSGVGLFICGHSHILRIQYDASNNWLFMNPGAAGHQGWHKTRTILRFTIDEND